MGRNYSRKSDPTLSDLAFIWDAASSDWKLVTFSDISTLLQSASEETDTNIKEMNTQYSAPSAAGFTVQVNDDDEDTHLILIPTGTLADGTIKLPLVTNLRDKQKVLVSCTQQITTLTVDSNGTTAVNGAPSALGADDYFTLKYDLAVDAWYRVG